jgi:DNA replication protein DnaC
VKPFFSRAPKNPCFGLRKEVRTESGILIAVGEKKSLTLISLVCAIGNALVRQGRYVFFTTCRLLVQELLLAKRKLHLPRMLKKLARHESLIIGYVHQGRDKMDVLFTLLAERYERGSVMITSNLPFSKWETIFKDPMMTAAAAA